MRPKQWLKNLMLFFPPFLGGAIINITILYKGVVPFIAFCLASSAVYISNDIHDRESDSKHPKKRHRPIPSGKVSSTAGWLIFLILLVSAIGLSILISFNFTLYVLIYLLISFAYTYIFRDIAVIDLFCISTLFIVRLLAGGVAFGIVVSDWLFLSVFLLAVFLSTGKRLSEKQSLGNSAGGHRKSLGEYPEGFLDGIMYMTGGAVLVTYTMYVITRSFMVYSVPLCCFGLLRYIYRVKRGKGGDPTDSLLHDIPLLFISISWALLVGWGIYGR
jgi:4-hydroxybenzoate polyprenyltransferase